MPPKMASQGTAFHSLVIDNCSWSLSVRVRFASPVLVYTCRMHIFGSVSVCILWIARSYGGPCLRRPQGLGRAHKGHFIPGILYRLHTSFLPYDRRKEQKNDARTDKRGRQSAAGRRNFKGRHCHIFKHSYQFSAYKVRRSFFASLNNVYLGAVSPLGPSIPHDPSPRIVSH